MTEAIGNMETARNFSNINANGRLPFFHKKPNYCSYNITFHFVIDIYHEQNGSFNDSYKALRDDLNAAPGNKPQLVW